MISSFGLLEYHITSIIAKQWHMHTMNEWMLFNAKWVMSSATCMTWREQVTLLLDDDEIIMQSSIFIVLDNWNSIPRIDMSLHSKA